jgi:hypothetical protein
MGDCMRCAVIEAGFVKNIIESDNGILPGYTLVLDDGTARIGGAWDGTHFHPEIITPVVPQEVTPRQARLALLRAGLLTTVNNYVASVTGAEGDSMRVEWEFANMISRTDPLIVSLAPALGLTPAQIDQLFIQAAIL